MMWFWLWYEAPIWYRFLRVKVNIFGWRTSLDHITVSVNLDKRWVDVESFNCTLCDSHLGMTKYPVFSRYMVASVGETNVSCKDLITHLVVSIKKWLSWTDNMTLNARQNHCFDVVLLTMIWSIWNLWNNGSTKITKTRYVW